MSKMNIVFDTETKELIVSIDGSKVDNVQELSIYKYKMMGPGEEGEEGEEYFVATFKTKEDISEDVNKCGFIQYMSKADINKENGVKSKYKGFNIVDNSQLEQDILKYFSLE